MDITELTRMSPPQRQASLKAVPSKTRTYRIARCLLLAAPTLTARQMSLGTATRALRYRT